MPRHVHKVPKGSTVDEWLENIQPDLRPLATSLRELILRSAPVEERVLWGYPWYVKDGHVCYIGATRDHITFGLARGKELSDPDGRLKGKGKHMGHLHIRSVDDIDEDQFADWVRQAVELNTREGE
jgi:hypothetical protein